MAKAIDSKMVKAVEAHGMKMTAACDDGSAFFVFVGANGKEVLAGPVLLTPAKMKKLAALKPPRC